jgi:hypothetical protein
MPLLDELFGLVGNSLYGLRRECREVAVAHRRDMLADFIELFFACRSHTSSSWLRSSSVKVKKTSVKAELLIFEVVRNRRTENTRSQNPNACKSSLRHTSRTSSGNAIFDGVSPQGLINAFDSVFCFLHFQLAGASPIKLLNCKIFPSKAFPSVVISLSFAGPRASNSEIDEARLDITTISKRSCNLEKQASRCEFVECHGRTQG